MTNSGSKGGQIPPIGPRAPEHCEGWLLDIYPDAQEGAVLWLLEAAEDGLPPPGGFYPPTNAPRRRVSQAFPVTFYASGPNPRLRALWRYLQAQPGGAQPLSLSKVERRDLFQAQPLSLLAVQVANPIEQERLFAQVSQDFPDLVYYDADIPLPLRHAAVHGTFPLARLRITIDAKNRVQSLQVLDSPWELDPEPPPLRILSLEPDCDPHRAAPSALKICFTISGGLHRRSVHRSYCLLLQPERPLLLNLAAILRQCDPDLIQTAWGDTWLLPHLLELSKKLDLPLELNRDLGRDVVRKRAHSYFTYGQVIHRGAQVHLFGRWHIDIYNAMMFHDYGLEGILESARVSGTPVQSAARLSPGSGISAMQMATALRQEVLVPWHKQQAEDFKTALDLIHADQGGMVYQPKIGLHHDVAEIDFISMYPGIMVHFNISPETVGDGYTCARLQAESSEALERVPELNLWVDRGTKGLIPQTLEPLLNKRIALKQRLAAMPNWDPRRKQYKARSAAHKWLLVTCFGYLGYKNARFGRIEAHESVTAYSREALLRAKEAAEDLGFEVLHMYVDGLWVRKPGCNQTADIQPLLDRIVDRTHLPIALEGIYRWVAFLPSRMDARVPVPNRYFGAFQDGTLKVRGIEARRQDTPPFIAEVQMRLLEMMAAAEGTNTICLERSPRSQALAWLCRQFRALRSGKIPLEKLVVMQKLSRELELYHTPSPAARAAAQLAEAGRVLRPGQAVRFIFTRGKPGVCAWDLGENLEEVIDLPRYSVLLLRAASTVFQPFGIDERQLHDLIFSQAERCSLPLELLHQGAASLSGLAWIPDGEGHLSQYS